MLTARTFRNDPSLACHRDPELAKECFLGVAWTNVFKVGMKVGNPDDTMRQLLLRNFDTLAGEIDLIRPDVVVFSTGPSYDYFLQQSSLRAKVVHPKERVSDVSDLPPFIKCAIRTPHFRVLTNSGLPMIARLMTRGRGPA